MKTTHTEVAAKWSIAALALAAACAFAQEPQAGKAMALDAQSDKRMGYVTAQSDLVLKNDRLVLTLGAFNKGAKYAKLSPASITLTTASGKPVPLASLAQLEDETRAAFGGPPAKSPADYAKLPTAQRPIDVTASSESEGGYTGSESLGAAVGAPPPKKKKAPDEATTAKLNAALENLRLGILHDVEVEPRAAAGGQIVTQSFKFARGEPRKLKMAVDFAGELHEFEFEVPK